MKITKAKLVKGEYLEVSFSDGTAETTKSYPHTDAPRNLLKAFARLNHHLCDLTEQYDTTGQGDYDKVAARGYSIKGEGEKEGITITGVRSLASGHSITLNSPFISLDITESKYQNIKALVECLDSCYKEITSFMDNNKSQEEIQGKLFNAKPENVILQSKAPGEILNEADAMQQVQNGHEVDVTHLYVKSDEEVQQEMDEEMPLHISKMSVKQLKALGTPEAQEELQRRNADKNKRGNK